MRGRPTAFCAAFCAVYTLAAPAAQAQGRGGPNWTTYNSDAQRTSWMRTDPRISRESVQKPGAFQLIWKAKLDNQARQLNSLTQPVLLNTIISYKGFKSLLFVGGSSDNAYSIDYDLNRIFWSRRFTPAPTAAGTSLCPGGLTAITRATPLGNASAGRGAPPPPPPPASPARAGGAPPALTNNTNLPAALYAIASDGLAHVLNPQTGQDLFPPVKFLAPNAKVVGSVLVDNVLYAATADRCGNVPNGVWAVDFGSDVRTATSWLTNGGSIVGTAAPALGTDGIVYAAVGSGDLSGSGYSDAVIALQAKTLTLKDSFTTASPFTTGPVVFQYKDRQVVLVANKDGRLYLLDGASLGGTDHNTPLFRSSVFAGAQSQPALATWEEADGTRWVLVSSSGAINAETRFPQTNGSVTNGSVLAFKVVDRGGLPALQPAWSSRDINNPVSPIVVNGVVFALAAGSARGPSAILYVLDAATGKEFWNSGSAITSFVDSGALAAGDGQVYVPTHDNTLYAFGIPLEH